MGFGANEEFLFFELVNDSLEFSVARLQGHEGLSELYELNIELVSEDGDIEFDEVVGQGCVITINPPEHTTGDGGVFTGEVTEPRYIHGVVSHFEIADQGSRYTTYYAQVVPKIWVMQHRYNCRIYQEVSVQDIILQLFNELGLEGDEYRWDCNGSYSPIEYCVQYRESEFNFISRLMEEEGIFYYFEHEADKHVLVLHDDSTTLMPLEDNDQLTFNPRARGMVTTQNVYQFKFAQTLTPGKVTLRDYNFRQPTLKLEAEKQQDASQNREVFDYPGWFADKQRGTDLANVRLQSLNTYRKKGVGRSNVGRMIPGYSFFLDHDREAFNDEFLITRIEHNAVQAQAYQEHANEEGGSYNNKFTCIPMDTHFRPVRRAHIPIVEGAQTAIVTGPPGEEIYPDEHGRVKVQFHWDREGKADDNSSCWIRVSQLWAGQGYGGFSIPRVGQEVIVDFIEGNPDRPIITGRVHHADNFTPYKLPENKTVSTLKSNSSKGGGGFNEIRFEDKKDDEQIFIHAQKNQDTRVNNDAFEIIGNDKHVIVENDRFTQIKNDDHQIVKGNQNANVTGDVSQIFDANLSRETKGDESFKITGDRMSEITGSEHLKSSMDINHEAGMNYGIKSGMKIDAKAGMNINLQAGMQINIKAGPSFISIGPSGVMIGGPMVMINSGGAAGPANPAKPAKPGKPEKAKEAKEADTAEAGKVETVKAKPVPKKPDTYGPQAKTMIKAAESGTPFCEQCEAAKKKRQQEQQKGSQNA